MYVIGLPTKSVHYGNKSVPRVWTSKIRSVRIKSDTLAALYKRCMVMNCNESLFSSLDDHHLLKSDSRSSVKVLRYMCSDEHLVIVCPIQQLDDLFSKWGDQDCHTPVLLSWALLNFANQPSSADLEV